MYTPIKNDIAIKRAREMGNFDVADALSVWDRIREEEGESVGTEEMATRTFGYGASDAQSVNAGRVDLHINSRGVNFFSYEARRVSGGFK